MKKRRRRSDVPTIEWSLEEIEHSYWGEPDFPSGLVIRCHALRHVPIGTLTKDDLRCLIGQQIGVDVLVPLALTRLSDDPFDYADDLYPGALLNSIVALNSEYWMRNPDSYDLALEVVSRVADRAETAGADLEDINAYRSLAAVDQFLAVQVPDHRGR